MTSKLLSFGAAAVVTAGMAGSAFAADRFAPPTQPVPYSQLNAYLKGTEHQRAAIMAGNTDATAATSAGVNTSATTPATPAPTASPDATAPVATPLAPPTAPTPSAVNPPADVATPPTTPSSPGPQ